MKNKKKNNQIVSNNDDKNQKLSENNDTVSNTTLKVLKTNHIEKKEELDPITQFIEMLEGSKTIPRSIKKTAEFKAVIRQSILPDTFIPPHILKEYNDIDPDFAKEFVEMAKKNQEFTHSQKTKMLDGAIEYAKSGPNLLAKGQKSVFWIAVGALVLAGFLAYWGHLKLSFFSSIFPMTLILQKLMPKELISKYFSKNNDEDTE